MKAVYVGKNPVGSSMYLVGQQIVTFGGGVLCQKIDESMKGAETVICLVPEDYPKLHKAARFLGLGKIVLFLAANWEEFSLWERGAMLAQATETPLVVHSYYSHSEVAKSARELLAPSKVRSLGLHLIPYGVGEEFVPSKKDPTKWVVPYNRVNQSQKNLALHKEVTGLFKIVNPSTDHLFIVFSEGGFAKESDLSAYTMVPQPPTREEYLQLIADRGAFLCTSNYESFGIYYLELLCSGCVGVFINKPWIKALLPDYQLVANSKTEALALMSAVSTDYEKWYSYVKDEVIPYIRSTYVLKTFAQKILEL